MNQVQSFNINKYPASIIQSILCTFADIHRAFSTFYYNRFPIFSLCEKKKNFEKRKFELIYDLRQSEHAAI